MLQTSFMRTNLAQQIIRNIQKINAAQNAETSDVEDFFEQKKLNRRQFLTQTAVFGAASTLASCQLFSEKTQPRIAIIGAGIAGLNTAWVLKQAGITSTIYEAGYRIGGRIFTQENLLGQGLTTEMGAEFIDTNHVEMWRLIKQFNLETIDIKSQKQLIPETYFFDKKHYFDKNIVEALKPFASILQSDLDAIKKDKAVFRKFDYMPLNEYIESLGVTGWLKELLNTAFLSEYGWETERQSALNMLTVMTSDHSHNQFSMYGESDERFKVKGGNSLIIKALEKELKPQIKQGCTLVQVEKKNDKSYLLTFLGGKESIVKADIVVFALPFTKLRSVNLKKANLTPTKINAINNYQLGANGKILLGFKNAFWQNQKNGKYLGNVFSDEFACGWDNSLLQNKSNAGYTVFYGGNQSENIGKLDNNGLKNMFLPALENVFQGANENFNGEIHRYHWQGNSLSLGSYTCFAPGHYTEILAHTQTTIDQLYFAGEHCSDAFQGFMNGAAQTGRDAAEAILKKIKI